MSSVSLLPFALTPLALTRRFQQNAALPTARFSPSSPSDHGQLRSLRLRTQTPEGLAAAISRAEALAARGRGDGSGNSYFTASSSGLSGGGGAGGGGDDGDQLSGGGPTLEDEQVAAMA